MQILDPETIHVIGGSTLSYDMSSDVDIHEFNHKTREWTINPKSYDTITKLLPQLITDYDDGSSEQTIMKTLQPYFTKQGLIYKNDTHTWYDLDYAEHIQKLFKLTNSIYFKTQGHLDRMPTDLINIQTTDHNIAVSSQFSGIWMIAKISTRVTKNEFYQDVDLVRVNKKIFVPREG
jgi:hypothetical protein